MNILVLWLSTVIASFSIEIVNELRMFKDVSDNGYKIDMNRLAKIAKELNPNATKLTLLSLLIPIYNLMQVFERINLYNNFQPIIIDQLKVLDVLEEMTELENIEYLNKPTSLKAISISIKNEVKIYSAKSIKITKNGIKGEFFYEMDKTLDDITILRTTGSLAKLTKEKQKQILIENLIESANIIIDKYCNKENIINDLKDKEDLFSNKLDPKENININKQKEILENLKKELLNSKEISLSKKLKK